MIVQRCEVFVCNMENLTNSPLFLCECKYWGKSVDFNAMSTIVGELEETVWKEMEAVALLFCVTYQPYKKVRPWKSQLRQGRLPKWPSRLGLPDDGRNTNEAGHSIENGVYDGKNAVAKLDWDSSLSVCEFLHCVANTTESVYCFLHITFVTSFATIPYCAVCFSLLHAHVQTLHLPCRGRATVLSFKYDKVWAYLLPCQQSQRTARKFNETNASTLRQTS